VILRVTLLLRCYWLLFARCYVVGYCFTIVVYCVAFVADYVPLRCYVVDLFYGCCYDYTVVVYG